MVQTNVDQSDSILFNTERLAIHHRSGMECLVGDVNRVGLHVCLLLQLLWWQRSWMASTELTASINIALCHVYVYSDGSDSEW